MSSRVWLALIGIAAAGQPVAALKEAARLDAAGRCGEAQRIYDGILAQGNTAPAVLNNLGNHYLACGEPAKARAAYERVLRAVPAHGNATLQLARIAMGEGDFGRARGLLEKAAPSRPGDFDFQFLLGRALARTGQAARARETLERALRLRPDDTGAMLEAGLANAAAGDYPRAVFLLARAQAQAPREAAIALALARAAEDAGYYGDAVVAYGRYLELVPGDQAARRDRARALAQTPGGREEGERELARYVETHPADANGAFYLAQVVWRADAERALALLAQASRLDPRHAPARVARAWLLHRLGRSGEAVKELEAALAVAPKDVRALDQLGVALLALDRAAEAEAALRKAAALAPADADVALHLGRALMERGKEAEGERWLAAYEKLRPARQRDPRREAGMIELATMDAAARRAREIERFRTMARARPDDPLLQMHLAGLLLSDGQTDEARREYAALLTLNGDERVWTEAGEALLDAGDYATALPFLERAGAGRARPQAAALLLAKAGQYRKALEELARAKAGRDVALLEAVVLALSGDVAKAGERLKRLETMWPEWDRPWLVDGLMSADAGKLRRAQALGARDLDAGCAMLREWVFGGCRKQ